MVLQLIGAARPGRLLTLGQIRAGFTRASAGTDFDAAGKLTDYPADVARRGQTLINHYRNARAIGANAGSIGPSGNVAALVPTHWWHVNHSALWSLDVTPIEVNGMPGLRLRHYGTSTAGTTNETLEFDSRTTGTPIAPGSQVTGSFYYRLVAGSFPAGVTFNHRFIGTNTGGSLTENTAVVQAAPDATIRRAEQVATLLSTTNTMAGGMHMTVPPNTVADFTIEVFGPQLELGAVATALALPPIGTIRPGYRDEAPSRIATNYIRNPRMLGAVPGSPGTMPTNWGSAVGGGLTRTVVGTGEVAGVPYIDLRVSGVVPGTEGVAALPINLNFESGGSGLSTPWGTGRQITVSAWLQLVAGTIPVMAGGGIRLGAEEMSAAEGFLSSWRMSNDLGVDGTWRRVSHSPTPNNANCASGRPLLWVYALGGQSIDFTLRIGGPQSETGGEITDLILPPAGVIATASRKVPTGLPAPGLLLEGTVTNLVGQNGTAGAVVGTIGSGGALPTGWSTSGDSGIAVSVVGTGTEDGIPYVDVRMAGTTTGTFRVISFGNLSGLVANANFTASRFARRVGGTVAGIFNIADFLRFNQSAGGAQDVTAPRALSTFDVDRLGQARASRTGSNAGPLTGNGVYFLQFNWAAGSAVDYTLRIGLPQFELGDGASSPILTSGSTVSRASDQLAITGADFAALFGAGAPQGFVVLDVLVPQPAGAANQILAQLDDGTQNQRLTLRNNTNGTNIVGISVSSGNATLTAAAAVLTPGVTFRIGLRWGSGVVSICKDGGAVATSAAGVVAFGFANLRLGHNAGGLENLNGRILGVRVGRQPISDGQLQAMTQPGPPLIFGA